MITFLQFAAGWRRFFPLAAVAALLLGCASVPDPDPGDPWEGYNRSMNSFNEDFDRAIMRPTAEAYKQVVPDLAQRGIGNFFANLGDVWSFANNVLQGKPEPALSSFWRVAINSTIGLGGILDPATEMRLVRYKEDLGQTLGYWGVPPGPYLVLPILGPSTVRDAAALPVDYYAYPTNRLDDKTARYSLLVLRAVDTRARLLGASDLLGGAALDSYSFTRDAFLQKRLNDVYDGNPPEDEERWDLDD